MCKSVIDEQNSQVLSSSSRVIAHCVMYTVYFTLESFSLLYSKRCVFVELLQWPHSTVVFALWNSLLWVTSVLRIVSTKCRYITLVVPFTCRRRSLAQKRPWHAASVGVRRLHFECVRNTRDVVLVALCVPLIPDFSWFARRDLFRLCVTAHFAKCFVLLFFPWHKMAHEGATMWASVFDRATLLS